MQDCCECTVSVRCLCSIFDHLWCASVRGGDSDINRTDTGAYLTSSAVSPVTVVPGIPVGQGSARSRRNIVIPKQELVARRRVTHRQGP